MEDEILVKDQSGGFGVVGVNPVSQNKSTKPVSSVDGYLVLAEKVAKQFSLDLHDEVLDRRFKNVVLAQVKDIRTELQTLDALTKGIDVGGVGLEKIKAQQVVGAIKKEVGQKSAPKVVNQPIIITRAEKKPPVVKVQLEPKKVEEKKVVHSFSRDELDHELAPPPPVVSEKSVLTKIKNTPKPKKTWQGLNALVNKQSNKKIVKKIQPPVKKSPPQQSLVKAVELARPKKLDKKNESERLISRKNKPYIAKPLPSKPKGELKIKVSWFTKFKNKFSKGPKARSGISPNKELASEGSKGRVVPKAFMAEKRGKVTDIRAPNRLTGPVEELHNFKIVDFRKLSADPLKAILRIKDKIDLLEKQSFLKRMEGIEAWRASEIHRVYLSLGKESIEQGSSLDVIIRLRQEKKQPFLTKDEFLALGKLNKMLEY